MTDTVVSRPAVDAFDRLWPFIASQESGELSLDPDDRGNWTSGICGIGELRGSRFGVSAAAYPTLDIQHLTYGYAAALCRREYWLNNALRCDLLPGPVAILLCDAAWGSGPMVAARTLQRCVAAQPDGQIGDKTRAAVLRSIAQPPANALPSGMDVLLAEFAAARVLFESEAGTWSKYKGGWVRRITRSLCLARSLIA